jgi:hypothetical protein
MIPYSEYAKEVEQGEKDARTIAVLKLALEKIARWHGEFPETGRQWEDGSPMSYSAAFGSNGERDFMRQVATDALIQTGPTPAQTINNVRE